ncbi:hypothetical protein HDU97_007136 [Phlyctochytrium planicorne]|nr:hypothetical protein HDU97_007136 [Phlyctochytrium planicorne]
MERGLEMGITLDEFACLARCNGLDGERRNGDEVSFDQFLNDIKAISSGDGSVHMVVAFSRKLLEQSGDGHFSPIGGFHEKESQVLVLDVARFKYPSYFASAEKLYESLKPIDKETGRSRGYFLLRRANQSPLILSKIIVPQGRPLYSTLTAKLSQQIDTPSTLITLTEASMSPYSESGTIPQIVFREAGIDLAAPMQDDLAESHRQALESLMVEIQNLPLYSEIKNFGARANEGRYALAILFIFTLPISVMQNVPAVARTKIAEAREEAILKCPLLRAEIDKLSVQIESLMYSVCGGRQCTKPAPL